MPQIAQKRAHLSCDCSFQAEYQLDTPVNDMSGKLGSPVLSMEAIRSRT